MEIEVGVENINESGIGVQVRDANINTNAIVIGVAVTAMIIEDDITDRVVEDDDIDRILVHNQDHAPIHILAQKVKLQSKKFFE